MINQIPHIVSKVPIISINETFSFKKIIDSGVAINGDAAVIAAVVEASEYDKANM